MSNMLSTIIPKSDQANYDDFVNGITKTIKITNVSLAMGEQPVSIHYEGDNGKPYKPGKSMRRILVHCWGADATKYAGRSMTLYGDPSVVFAGQKVGGIRISHLSDIKEPITVALTASKAIRKPFTVQPLMDATLHPAPELDTWLDDIEACADEPHLVQKYKAGYKIFANYPDSLARLTEAKDKRKQQLMEDEHNVNS